MTADQVPPAPKSKLPLVLTSVALLVIALPIAGYLAIQPLYRTKPALRSKLEHLIVEQSSRLEGKSPEELTASLGKPGKISFWVLFPKKGDDFLAVEIPCDPDPSATPDAEIPPIADIEDEGEFLRQLNQRLNGQPSAAVRKVLTGLDRPGMEIEELWFYPNEQESIGMNVRFKNGSVSGLSYAD